MRFGIFGFWENYDGNDRRAYERQISLLCHAEALDFDELWLAEHHFGPFSPCPSILVLAGHLAALTTRIRIGTAAVLLPYQDPIRIAEDAATVDLLSGGRFNFGVARGGPIPLQEKHFHVAPEDSRRMTIERLDAINRLLHEDRVSVSEQYVHFREVTIQPKPVQAKVPIFVATSDREFVLYAARQGYGLLGAQAWPVDLLKQLVALAQAGNPIGRCPLAVMRPFLVAKSSKQAHQLADAGIEAFAARMKGYAQPPAEPGRPESGAAFEHLKANAIVGDPIEVLERIQSLMADLPMTSLVFRPAAIDGVENRTSLSLFAEQVRPFLNGPGLRCGEDTKS